MNEVTTKSCDRCMGSGKIANSDEGEPWPVWDELPEESKLAIRLGVIRPIPCPHCGGTGNGQPVTRGEQL